MILNIPQFKQIVNNTKADYIKMLEGEIRVVGLREKIGSRLRTIIKIEKILNEHKDGA